MSHLHLVSPVPQSEPILFEGPVRYLGPTGDPITEVEPADLATHYERYGLRPSWVGQGDTAVGLLAGAGLSGRGGAHFPVARKWQAVRTAAACSGRAPVVIANGAEGEPLSAKDAALLEFRPHLVLDGIACAAEALGADSATLWLHDGAHAARTSLNRALSERRRAHFRDVPIRIMTAPDHYLSGESSAAVAGVSGQPALPQFTLRPAAVSGVGGHPTLVQNVETLARIALIARGEDEASTVLLMVAAANQRIVVEVDADTTLAAAVRAATGDQRVSAALVGGYGGTWHRWPDIADLAVAPEALRAAGISLGAGVVLPVSPAQCGLHQAAVVARYLADASARQCGPCLFGLPAMASALEDLADRQGARRANGRLPALFDEVSGRGACHHPDGAITMIRSALAAFADDVAAHRRGRCLHDLDQRRRRR